MLSAFDFSPGCRPTRPVVTCASRCSRDPSTLPTCCSSRWGLRSTAGRRVDCLSARDSTTGSWPLKSPRVVLKPLGPRAPVRSLASERASPRYCFCLPVKKRQLTRRAVPSGPACVRAMRLPQHGHLERSNRPCRRSPSGSHSRRRAHDLGLPALCQPHDGKCIPDHAGGARLQVW